MTTSNQTGIRPLETDDEFGEARLEAIGFVFHGSVPVDGAKRGAVKGGTNLLHFARCGKLDRVGTTEVKIWFRSIRVAKQHLDEVVGSNRWKWCKICEREITQKVLNEH